MLRRFKKTLGLINSSTTKLYVKSGDILISNSQEIALFSGLGLLFAGLVEFSAAQPAPPAPINPNDFFVSGLCNVLSLPEGAFGALVMTVAGLMGVVGAAMGMYRLSLNCIIVAVGCYIVRPVVMLFFDISKCKPPPGFLPGS